MANINLGQEKNHVDFITDSMCSLDFLQGITNVIFSRDRDKFTVGSFYDQWLQESGIKDIKVPFSLGTILGCLYCGILFAKEHWFDLLPDVGLANADPEWGISGTTYYCTATTDRSLKYVVKRIRNALGHGNADVNIPKDMKDRAELMTRVTLQFHDVNIRRPSDTFDIELSLDQLSKFIKAFQSLIHKHVRSKTMS